MIEVNQSSLVQTRSFIVLLIGNVVSLNTFEDPFLAAVLIKKYLRDLPEPIFSEKLYPIIQQCPSPNDASDMVAITYIRDVIFPELVPCAYILLSHVLRKSTPFIIDNIVSSDRVA
jgi:hypothetical protein